MTNYVHIFKDYKKDFREFRLALQNRVVYSPTFLKIVCWNSTKRNTEQRFV